MPAERAASRLARRDGEESDAIGGRDARYHAAVAAAFAAMAEAEPDRFVRIAADGSVEETHAAVMDAIADLLETSR